MTGPILGLGKKRCPPGSLAYFDDGNGVIDKTVDDAQLRARLGRRV